MMSLAMRSLLFALCFAGVATAGAFDHSTLDAVLKRYVDDGHVDYATLKENRAPLDQYLAAAGAVERVAFDAWSEEAQLAFLINLYNAATLQLVIEHYPIDSIKDAGGWLKGPWDMPIVALFGEQVTLNTLEHEMIRKDYAEPRIHFALVCAAKSCPTLRSEAYTGDALDAQLADQARIFLADASKNHLDQKKETLYLSSIFKWYGADFGDGDAALTQALLPFMPEADAAWLRGHEVRIKYLKYDWSLNR